MSLDLETEVLPPENDSLNLRTGLEHVWSELECAVKQRRHGFHTFTLATVTGDGLPEARTMVLRGVNRDLRQLTFHTDNRAPKVADLKQNPHVCVLFYGPKEKLQVRVRGTVTLHQGNSVTQAAWEKMLPMSRECYRTPYAPGTIRIGQSGTTEAESLPLYAVSESVANLCVCHLHITGLEWLSLAYSGHCRARYTWTQNGDLTAEWLTP